MRLLRRSWVRGIFPILLLLLAALFLHRHLRAEVLPPHTKLAMFPSQIGAWAGRTLTIPSADLAILGPGEFLERDYQDPVKPAGIDLFIAYFPSQKTGDTIHSPKHCLPGAGWTPVVSSVIQVPWDDGKILHANYYVLQLGGSREVVIYWFQSHGRTVASEYWARFYLVTDALSMNRTDGALVRLISPVANQEPLESAKGRVLAFTKQILPLLRNYIPQ
ncbi:MAG TPA: EpsI family protein [Terriglobia bacterium]|nr:EpsI family protein [Terriglobia bacterium]